MSTSLTNQPICAAFPHRPSINTTPPTSSPHKTTIPGQYPRHDPTIQRHQTHSPADNADNADKGTPITIRERIPFPHHPGSRNTHHIIGNPTWKQPRHTGIRNHTQASSHQPEHAKRKTPPHSHEHHQPISCKQHSIHANHRKHQ